MTPAGNNPSGYPQSWLTIIPVIHLIATCDLHTHVTQILTGKSQAMPEADFFSTLQKYKRQYSMRSRAGMASYSS